MRNESGLVSGRGVVTLLQSVQLLRKKDDGEELHVVKGGFAKARCSIILGPPQNMTLDGQRVEVAQVMNAGGVRFVSLTDLQKQRL